MFRSAVVLKKCDPQTNNSSVPWKSIRDIHFPTPTQTPGTRNKGGCLAIMLPWVPSECDAGSSLRSPELEEAAGTKGQDDKYGLHTEGGSSEQCDNGERKLDKTRHAVGEG